MTSHNIFIQWNLASNPADGKSLSTLRGQLLSGPGMKAENQITSISRSLWNCSVFLLVREIMTASCSKFGRIGCHWQTSVHETQASNSHGVPENGAEHSGKEIAGHGIQVVWSMLSRQAMTCLLINHRMGSILHRSDRISPGDANKLQVHVRILISQNWSRSHGSVELNNTWNLITVLV